MTTQDKILQILVKDKLSKNNPYIKDEILDATTERVMLGIEMHLHIIDDIFKGVNPPEDDWKPIYMNVEDAIKNVTDETV